MRAAILCLALLLGACTAGSGVPRSTDTNPVTGTHGGGNAD